MTAKSSRYRVGIVGAGNISRLHLDGIARHPDRTQVVALCDPDEATAKARAADYGVSSTYFDLGRMIAEAGLDVAIVCTPTHVRKAVIWPLLDAGIPVFCEKPFAETYSEAAEIAQKAQETGVPVAVNQNFRRHFAFHVARDLLDQGHLGRPLHLVQVANRLRRDRGWRLERRRYVMAVMSIHWFDGYRYLLGEEPERVYCQGVNSPATDGGEDTAVSVTLTFPSGTVVSLSESFSSFARHEHCCLDCEAGALAMDYGSLQEIRASGDVLTHDNPYDKPEATYYLLNDLMQAAASGRAPETGAADNLNTMRILEAAYRSLQENRPVAVATV